jgi:hypothetical protein
VRLFLELTYDPVPTVKWRRGRDFSTNLPVKVSLCALRELVLLTLKVLSEFWRGLLTDGVFWHSTIAEEEDSVCLRSMTEQKNSQSQCFALVLCNHLIVYPSVDYNSL